MPASLILTIIITPLLYMRPLLGNSGGTTVYLRGHLELIYTIAVRALATYLGAHRLDVNPASR